MQRAFEKIALPHSPLTARHVTSSPRIKISRVEAAVDKDQETFQWGERGGKRPHRTPFFSLSLSPRPRRCGKGFEGESLSLSPLSPFSKEGRDGDGGAEVGGGWDGWKSNSAHAGAAHLTLPAQRSLPLFSPSFPLPNLPTPSSVQFTKSLDLFLGQMACHPPNTQEHGVVTPWFVLC